MVVAFMFVPLAVALMLPLLAAALLPPPADNRAFLVAGAGILTAAALVLIVGYAVFPTRGFRLQVCFDIPVIDDVGDDIYSIPTGTGRPNRPGITSYGGGAERSFVLEFEPFVEQRHVEDVIRRAGDDPAVTGWILEDELTGRCPDD